jgi:AcrR family transcriptional regulator
LGENRYHHGDLRRTLVREALALVAEEGIAALTLRAVARRAGVSHGAPYRHFKGLAGLMAAVAAEGFRALEWELRNAPPGDDPVQALGIAYVAFAVRDPARFRVMFGPETAAKADWPELQEASLQAMAAMQDAVANMEGLRTDDPAGLLLASWSIVHGLASLLVNQQVPKILADTDQVDDLAERVTRALRDGLKR